MLYIYDAECYVCYIKKRVLCYLANMYVTKISLVLLVLDLLYKLLSIILILSKLYGDKLFMDKLCEGKL